MAFLINFAQTQNGTVTRHGEYYHIDQARRELNDLLKCIATHKDANDFQPTTFGQKDYLTSHMKYVHDQSERSFKCGEHCGKSFLYESEMATHIQRAHEKPSYKCNFCHIFNIKIKKNRASMQNILALSF